MKFLCVAGLLLAGLLLTANAQQEADERYIGIYNLMQQADGFAQTGDPGEAVAAFTDAQNQLQQLKTQFPDWNPNIVSFRLSQISDKIAELKNRADMVAAAKKSVMTDTNNSSAVTTTPAATDDSENLRGQLQAAQVANDALQAKLKEALAVQPAAVDPRELEAAQMKIRELMKQVDLLKVSAVVTNIVPVTQIVTNVSTVFITNTLPPVTNVNTVYVTNGPVPIVTNVVVTDPNALEMAKLDLAAAVKNFNDEHDRAEQLANQLQQLRQNPNSSTNNSAANTTDAEAALATIRAENENLKTALAAATNASPSAADYEARIRALTQERDALAEKLNASGNAVPAGTTTSTNIEVTAQISALNDEVSSLRSRLAVLDAAPVAYSPEELALLKAAVPAAANPDAEKKSITEMPAGTAELVASAQLHFAHQEYDAAEADYMKILDRDPNNAIALANLATIELQQSKLDEAEAHITAALKQTPDDAYNLSTLGYLKFRQEKYDEAFKALSRAEQIDPNNPEIENYLGVTLSHQGQRKAAETALRRAIMLNPNYAPAHNNLAVIYLSQTPPQPEMARWHYQKALDAGQPRNPDLEKMLADKGAPVAP